MNIRKVPIANGITWVEIPEADLRILCGSPEDSIKHLIRRGFVHEAQRDGCTYETGPNAILLSDVSTQDGSFCNVAEFPVLQMLYRQGMIIPGHPNNTGVKPLLIGSETQVRAQLEYIFRGNYGLTTVEEMIEAGASKEEAHDLMRLKLKFAFGAIKPPRDFLESYIIEDEVVCIQNDVCIHRVSVNVFEISYKGETVQVNLNLAPGQSYEPPYHLGYYALKHEYFAIVHSGDGDGWDCNRPSMASIIMYQGRIFLIDAGPNIGNTLKSLGISISEVEGIFLTHSHDDHFAGITTLMRADRPLKFFSTSLVRASALKKLSALVGIQEKEFSNLFDFFNLNAGEWNDIIGLEVMPFASPHPVENTCMMFRAIGEDGYKTYAHMADIVSLTILEGMITDDPNAPGLSQASFDNIKSSYLQAVDIKKIDAGGGLIHGEVADFANDTSHDILLAHRASPWTLEERKIGSGSPFGTSDVLIYGQQEYTYQKAARLLKAYFPNIAPFTLQSLLNGPIVEYNPETLICKEGTITERPILLLRGQVERLSSDTGQNAQLPAGAIIGELSAIENTPLSESYRATSFVTTLQLPAAPFKKFCDDQNIAASIHKFAPVRDFLQQTSIFNNNMTRGILLNMVDTSRPIHLKDGRSINWDTGDGLYLVQKGKVDLVFNGHVKEELSELSFCGESFVLFEVAPIYKAVARGNAVLLRLNPELISKIPIARWKLLETHQRRIDQMVIHSLEHYDTLVWVDDFLIDIPDMDRQHKNLFGLANEVLNKLTTDAPHNSVIQAMDALTKASKDHFAQEESLLTKEVYPDLGIHHGVHVKLMNELYEMGSRLQDGERISNLEFHNFFLSWLVLHILNEDRRYARFIEESSDFLI
ncbi:MAG: bacteriohemerythrin [Magnetovibrio sp.]|nr:bacteriohemerythrin [Magnetovibrio sp.]